MKYIYVWQQEQCNPKHLRNFPISSGDISFRQHYPSYLPSNSSALVVWQRLRACVICTFQPELVKLGRPVSEQSWSAWVFLTVNKEKGFSPTWLCSSRLPPPTEHYVTIWNVDLVQDELDVPTVEAELFQPYCFTYRVITHLQSNTCVHHSQHEHPTSVEEHCKKSFSHYWVTFYRKRHILYVFLQHMPVSDLSSWPRGLPSDEPQAASTNQMWRNTHAVILHYYGTYSIQF